MLNFERKGNGKETLVLLHGFMENLSIWSDMEPHLSKDFSLLKIDLPGHGQSEILGEVHTMEMMAEEVKKYWTARILIKCTCWAILWEATLHWPLPRNIPIP